MYTCPHLHNEMCCSQLSHELIATTMQSGWVTAVSQVTRQALQSIVYTRYVIRGFAASVFAFSIVNTTRFRVNNQHFTFYMWFARFAFGYVMIRITGYVYEYTYLS